MGKASFFGQGQFLKSDEAVSCQQPTLSSELEKGVPRDATLSHRAVTVFFSLLAGKEQSFFSPSDHCQVLCVCSVISVMSNSVLPCGLKLSRLLCPWDSPGKNIGVGRCPSLRIPGCHAHVQSPAYTSSVQTGVLRLHSLKSSSRSLCPRTIIFAS